MTKKVGEWLVFLLLKVVKCSGIQVPFLAVVNESSSGRDCYMAPPLILKVNLTELEIGLTQVPDISLCRYIMMM